MLLAEHDFPFSLGSSHTFLLDSRPCNRDPCVCVSLLCYTVVTHNRCTVLKCRVEEVHDTHQCSRQVGVLPFPHVALVLEGKLDT